MLQGITFVSLGCHDSLKPYIHANCLRPESIKTYLSGSCNIDTNSNAIIIITNTLIIIMITTVVVVIEIVIITIVAIAIIIMTENYKKSKMLNRRGVRKTIGSA